MNRIRHTGLVTNNLKKSLFFWNKVLKLKIKKRALEKGDLIEKIMQYKKAHVETIKLVDTSGMILEILNFKNAPLQKKKPIKPYSYGFTHISLTVNNINKVYKKLKSINVDFNSEPTKSEDGTVMMTYCKTPEGAYLELVEELKKK